MPDLLPKGLRVSYRSSDGSVTVVKYGVVLVCEGADDDFLVCLFFLLSLYFAEKKNGGRASRKWSSSCHRGRKGETREAEDLDGDAEKKKKKDHDAEV
ncbi:hypothetical protein CDL15_Pgr012916 [Punica granatum]|uniref:Uncharacterized protein n=1 Tax=Punica granatum TaxID=22663 RepID=A0A218XDZ4_PUNGR|nr:hypothetical protein CDL15_Pgr012916 [Punica granatum]